MGASILVAYATKYGSTAGVAETIGRAIHSGGTAVEVRPAREVSDITGYRAVVVGGPIFWAKPHADVIRFLRRHADGLRRVPVACFLTCMELTTIPETVYRGVPVTLDPDLGGPPRSPGKPTSWERSHLVSMLADHLIGAAPGVSPAGLAVFRGKVDDSVVGPAGRLVLRLGRRLYGAAPEGDFRNWEAIESWAAGLPAALAGSEPDRT